MDGKKRRSLGAEFEAMVAMEALRSVRAINEISGNMGFIFGLDGKVAQGALGAFRRDVQEEVRLRNRGAGLRAGTASERTMGSS